MIIGICDDDKIWCEKAQQYIAQHTASIGINADIRCFQSCDALFACASSKETVFDVIFMDIQLQSENENGIDAARKINQIWPRCQLVYLTDYLFYATEVYHTNHCYFVLKEQFAQKIASVFEKIVHVLQQSSCKHIFTAKGGLTLSVAPCDIVYFERSLRSTKLVTVFGSYELHEKLSEIKNTVSEFDFVRCHNSYIVYLPAVRELKKDTIFMENGDRIPISRSCSKNTKQHFAQWALRQMP